jgi:hypothetical protein
LDVTQCTSVVTDVSGQPIVQLPKFRDNLSFSSSRVKVKLSFALLECYTAQIVITDVSGQPSVPNFKGPAIQSSSDRLTLEDGTKTWLTDYESTLRNISEERRSRLPSGGCRLSRIPEIYCIFSENLQFIQWFVYSFLRFIWSQDSVTRTITTQGCKKEDSHSISARCKSFYSKRSGRIRCPSSLPFSGCRRLSWGVQQPAEEDGWPLTFNHCRR